MLPQRQQDTCETQDQEPNSCFSDLSDSLNSLNLIKTPLVLFPFPVPVPVPFPCSVNKPLERLRFRNGSFLVFCPRPDGFSAPCISCLQSLAFPLQSESEQREINEQMRITLLSHVHNKLKLIPL